MNLFKFQYLIAFFAIALLLNGCVVAPYDERADYLSKKSLSNTSAYSTVAADAAYHIVQRGDTLYGISRRYGFDYHDVAAWNNIYPPYTIWPGQQLLIYSAPVVNTLSVNQYPRVVPASYHSGVTSLSYQTSNVVPVNYSSRRIVPLGYSSSNVVPLNYSNSNIVPLNYRTSTTLPVYYTTHSAVPVNYSDDSYTYMQSQSALSATPITTVVPITRTFPSSNFHTVQAGENFASIADLYGLTTYELALWNNITSPYTVYPGQRLLIVSP